MQMTLIEMGGSGQSCCGFHKANLQLTFALDYCIWLLDYRLFIHQNYTIRCSILFDKRTKFWVYCCCWCTGWMAYACTYTQAYFPPGPGCPWGCGNGVTPAVAGSGDKRCCFKLWRQSFLGAAVYPPLKYNGGLWRLERRGQRLPSVCCFERRRN